MNETAFNYNEAANTDDGSCIDYILGCMNETALNYDSAANTDDGSCIYIIEGCTDLTADNYDASANQNNGSCEYSGVPEDCPSLIFDAVNTGSNMTLFLVPSGASDLSVLGNGTIGVYYTDSNGHELCGGSAEFSGAQVQISAYANDATTSDKDGFFAGDDIIWKFQDNNGHQYNLSPNPQDVYITNGISFISAITYNSITCLTEEILGCVNPSSINYNSAANTDDGSCIDIIEGCVNETAFNYNEAANTDDDSCISWQEAYLNYTTFQDSGQFSQFDIDAAYQAGFHATDDGVGLDELDSQADLSYGYGYEDGYEEGLNSSSGSCEAIYIDLISGWNIIGYTLSFAQDITATLSSIVDNIKIMKNNDASVFWPEFGFNGIGDFIPGQGYQILMLNSLPEYTFPDVSGERIEMTPSVPDWVHDFPALIHPNETKTLVKVLNILGQEVNPINQFKGDILLNLYSDGSVQKYILE